VCPVFLNYQSVARKHQALVDFATLSLLQQRIGSCKSHGRCDDFITHCKVRKSVACNACGYWQASQSGLSMEQNLMSVAGSEIGAAATPDADPLDTELRLLDAMVDFSEYVALVVRK
jgi:hypothetical protein